MLLSAAIRMLNRETLRQLVIFGLVGVTATITHYTTALTCHEMIGFNLHVANFIGYACAVGVSYFGHGLLTFRVKLNRSVLRRFVLVSVTTYLASAAILAGLEEGLNVPHRLSLAVVVMIIPLISFLLNKLWVYRHPEAR
jgi:putative flippase GtrA